MIIISQGEAVLRLGLAAISATGIALSSLYPGRVGQKPDKEKGGNV